MQPGNDVEDRVANEVECVTDLIVDRNAASAQLRGLPERGKRPMQLGIRSLGGVERAIEARNLQGHGAIDQGDGYSVKLIQHGAAARLRRMRGEGRLDFDIQKQPLNVLG